MTNSSYLKFIGVVLLLIVVALGIATAVVHSQFKDARNPEEKEMKRQHRKNLAISFLVFVAVWVMFLIVSNSLSKQKRSEIHPSRGSPVQVNDTPTALQNGSPTALPKGSPTALQKGSSGQVNDTPTALQNGSPGQVNDTPAFPIDEDEDAINDIQEYSISSDVLPKEFVEKSLEKGEVEPIEIDVGDGKRVEFLKVCCTKTGAKTVNHYVIPKGYRALKATGTAPQNTKAVITKRNDRGDATDKIVVLRDTVNNYNVPVIAKTDDGDNPQFVYIPKKSGLGKQNISDDQLIKIKRNELFGYKSNQDYKKEYLS